MCCIVYMLCVAREALEGSTVVSEVEGDEAVFHLSQWSSDSSEEEDSVTPSKCGVGECVPENWD